MVSKNRSVSATKQSNFPQRAGGNPKRADAALVSRRIEIIYDLIQKGYRRSQILRFVETNRYVLNNETGTPIEPQELNPLFDYRESTLDRYIDRANKQLEDLAANRRMRNLGLSEARYEMIIRQALQNNDLFNAINAQKQLDRVQGNERAPKHS